jgi:hypothetical protein
VAGDPSAPVISDSFELRHNLERKKQALQSRLEPAAASQSERDVSGLEAGCNVEANGFEPAASVPEENASRQAPRIA